MFLRRLYNPCVKFVFAYSYFKSEAGVCKNRLLCFLHKFEAAASLLPATAPYCLIRYALPTGSRSIKAKSAGIFFPTLSDLTFLGHYRNTRIINTVLICF